MLLEHRGVDVMLETFPPANEDHGNVVAELESKNRILIDVDLYKQDGCVPPTDHFVHNFLRLLAQRTISSRVKENLDGRHQTSLQKCWSDKNFRCDNERAGDIASRLTPGVIRSRRPVRPHRVDQQLCL